MFQFTPSHLDITEAFWTFLIPEHNISVPFLLVGKAKDPLISLDKSHINFSSLLIGKDVLFFIFRVGLTWARPSRAMGAGLGELFVASSRNIYHF